jgi:hypothetical protein
MIDTGGLILFHLATVGLVICFNHKDAEVGATLGALVLGLDLNYFYSPPKQRAKLDPKPESEPDNPAPLAAAGSFAFELFVLFAPPLAFVIWLQFLIWRHQTLSRNELMAIVIAMPALVGLVSWIMQCRAAHHPVGIGRQTNRFIAFSILGIWIIGTFFFVLFLGGFLMRCFQL